VKEPTYGGSYRAAVIGHTGQGNYGHGLDEVFVGLPRVEIVGLADPVEAGRERAARAGAARYYANCREMLQQERPDLVSIAPRFPGPHAEMLMAAVENGAEPVASGHNARAALEMILAVYESHAAGQRIALPLEDRTHPLTRWRS
jgi:predicted dehydrogenase